MAVKNHLLDGNSEENGCGISLSLKSVLNIHLDPDLVLKIMYIVEWKTRKDWESITPKD